MHPAALQVTRYAGGREPLEHPRAYRKVVAASNSLMDDDLVEILPPMPRYSYSEMAYHESVEYHYGRRVTEDYVRRRPSGGALPPGFQHYPHETAPAYRPPHRPDSYVTPTREEEKLYSEAADSRMTNKSSVDHSIGSEGVVERQEATLKRSLLSTDESSPGKKARLDCASSSIAEGQFDDAPEEGETQIHHQVTASQRGKEAPLPARNISIGEVRRERQESFSQVTDKALGPGGYRNGESKDRGMIRDQDPYFVSDDRRDPRPFKSYREPMDEFPPPPTQPPGTAPYLSVAAPGYPHHVDSSLYGIPPPAVDEGYAHMAPGYYHEYSAYPPSSRMHVSPSHRMLADSSVYVHPTVPPHHVYRTNPNGAAYITPPHSSSHLHHRAPGPFPPVKAEYGYPPASHCPPYYDVHGRDVPIPTPASRYVSMSQGSAYRGIPPHIDRAARSFSRDELYEAPVALDAYRASYPHLASDHPRPDFTVPPHHPYHSRESKGSLTDDGPADSGKDDSRVPQFTTKGSTPLESQNSKKSRKSPLTNPTQSGIAQYITVLNENDVLLGRGKGVNDYVGNRKFRDLIKDHRQEYLGSTRGDKTHIARHIVEAVKQLTPQGRFLKKVPNTRYWVVVEKQVALEKTSQALREGSPKSSGSSKDDETPSGRKSRKRDEEDADVGLNTSSNDSTDQTLVSAKNDSDDP